MLGICSGVTKCRFHNALGPSFPPYFPKTFRFSRQRSLRERKNDLLDRGLTV